MLPRTSNVTQDKHWDQKKEAKCDPVSGIRLPMGTQKTTLNRILFKVVCGGLVWL